MSLLKQYRRFRTPILAVVATMTFVGAAVYSFDVPWRDIGAYFVAATLLVLLIMVPASIMGGLLYWRRRAQARKRAEQLKKHEAELSEL